MNTFYIALNYEFINIFFTRHNINLLGIASDADARLLSSMKFCTQPLLSSSIEEILNGGHQISYLQDIFHLLTKLRNRLLKQYVNLPMGSSQVSVAHLKVLINTVDKSVHGLVKTDICPDDRQNVKSLQKCFDDRVLNALKDHVPGSDATIIFLKYCREIYTAFYDTNLTPCERVRQIWHTTYFFRAWRSWILKNKNTASIGYNRKIFVTDQAYACLELNAYGLLDIIGKLRDLNLPEQFLPFLFTSQTCEETFRILRSMTTINWTRINFTMLEVLQMMGRLELVNNIIYDKLSTKVKFPRIQNKPEKYIVYDLPTNDEITTVLKEAKTQAILNASKFGMKIEEEDLELCGILKEKRGKSSQPTANDMNDETLNGFDDDEDEEMDVPLIQFTQENDIDLLEFEPVLEKSFLNTDTPNNQKFVQVSNNDGSVKNVLKSSVIWALTESKGSSSKDRLKRVQSKIMTVDSPRRECRKRPIDTESETTGTPSKKQKKQKPILHAHELEIGDWTVFRSTSTDENESKFFFLGMVLRFRYVNVQKEKDKQYTLDFVPTSAENTSNRGIEVLATWFHMDSKFISQPIHGNNSFFINIENYIGTIEMSIETKRKITNGENVKIEISSADISQLLSNQLISSI